MKQLMKKNLPQAYLEGQKKHVRSGRLYELKMFSKHVDMIEQLDLLVDDAQPDREKVLWQDYKAGCDVLCIGARYGVEMLAMREMGFAPAKLVGIDLYPRCGEVRRADMHDLPFAAASFDVIYSHLARSGSSPCPSTIMAPKNPSTLTGLRRWWNISYAPKVAGPRCSTGRTSYAPPRDMCSPSTPGCHESGRMKSD